MTIESWRETQNMQKDLQNPPNTTEEEIREF